MNRDGEQDVMRSEYDFSSGVRGQHHKAYRQGTNLVLLEPDVAEVFKDSAQNAGQDCAGPRIKTNPSLTASCRITLR